MLHQVEPPLLTRVVLCESLAKSKKCAPSSLHPMVHLYTAAKKKAENFYEVSLPSCSAQYGLYIFCSLCRWTECSTQSNYTQSSGRSVQALFVFWPGFSCALLETHSCMASLLANSTACWLCTR